MPLKLNSSAGGSVTLDVPATAGTFTATVPANTGTLVTTGSTAAVTQGMLASGVAGNGPAFSAYLGSGQSISHNVLTKMSLNIELFDTNACYDTSLFRFTPNVAGYYFLTGRIVIAGGSFVVPHIFKNGQSVKEGVIGASVNNPYGSNVSGLIYLNGSSDYAELYGYQGSGSTQTATAGSNLCFFDGFLARAA